MDYYIKTAIAKSLVSNLNTHIMLDHLEYVEHGIRQLDDDFYMALRIREQREPNGRFLKLTSRIERAICTAGLLHKGQYRKGAECKVPYISHPLSVAEIVAKHTDDENTICASILHDTLEDTSYTKEQMINDFGEAGHDEEIFHIVNDVTEQDKTLPWSIRKQQAFEHIAQMDHRSLLVKSADVLHNMTCLTGDVYSLDDAAFNKFNASKEDIMLRYQKIMPELRKYWHENPLNNELEAVLKKLLDLI